MARSGHWHPCMMVLLLSLGLVVSGQMEMNIEAIPLLTQVVQETPTKQSVMFRFQAPEVSESEGVSQDLIIILDVSGSMRSDAKLEKAKVAISGIINSLRPGDRLHLITYDTDAQVEFARGTVENQSELLAAVAALTPRGVTNMHAGLEAAEPIIRAESDSLSVKRIFLFSDGLVNRGVTHHPAILKKIEHLREQGATTSAFGIGADYDRNLMSAISETGHGNYFFIQGQEDMEKVIRVATAGVRSLFATEAELRIVPLNGAAGLHVYGESRMSKSGTHDDISSTLKLGDLRGGDTKTVLVDLELPRLSVGTDAFLSFELSYRLAGGSEPVTTKQDTVKVEVVASADHQGPPNHAVKLFRQLQITLAREINIEGKIASGDMAGAGSMEQDLEEELEGIREEACAPDAFGNAPSSIESMHSCSRATVAKERSAMWNTKLFKSGSVSRSMAQNAYMFKRKMNEELSEAHDEL